MTLSEFKTKLELLAGELIEKMENATPEMAVLLLAQARTCLVISKDTKKLKRLYKAVNDGTHTLP